MVYDNMPVDNYAIYAIIINSGGGKGCINQIKRYFSLIFVLNIPCVNNYINSSINGLFKQAILS